MKSIQDLIKWNLDSTKNDGENESRFVFRGVSNKDYQLIPKIYRNKDKTIFKPIQNPEKRIKRLEAYLKIHLSDYGFNLHHYEEKNRKWHELFLAQHYGAPTYLLDFTRNPLVAAFFACKSQPKEDAKIYAIKIKEQDLNLGDAEIDYNIATYDLLQCNPSELTEPKFVVPPMIDKRIQTQIAIFCCFPTKSIKQLSDYDSFNHGNENEHGFIKEFIIKSTDKAKILDELNKIGINDKTLFPDMTGFGNFVSWKLLNME